jgi:UDP-N-acetylglucosamine--N-acetylmuramyl-(pentapeptide) pyrophosphoryl-undecaprenol N-acetylglucosamine transferase
VYGLPSILIPYPFAAENHQALNAEIFERHGAAAVLNQGAITAEVLAEKVRWLSDPARLAEMSRHARELTPANAAERVVEVIAEAVRAREAAMHPSLS